MAYLKQQQHSEHFILVGTDRLFFEREAAAIVRETRSSVPAAFSGEQPSFSFDLRYVPPFDKDFRELKRLQGTAAQAAGRRDAFRGCILLNVSEYLGHENEFYFDVILSFLRDQTDDWRYIFLVSDENHAAASALVRRLLSIPRSTVAEQAADARFYHKSFLLDACAECGVICHPRAFGFLEDVLTAGTCSREAVSVTLQDLAARCGLDRTVTMDSVRAYFASAPVNMRYMLAPKQHQQILMTLGLQEKEEDRYDKIS